jgi:hypothetical protein
MPADVLGWAARNPGLVLTAVLGLVALAWAYDAYEDAEDGRDALAGFAGNAKQGTGGALNVVLVSVVMVVGWAATWFATAGEFVQFLLTFAPEYPVLTASLVSISLGSLGLQGAVELRAVHFLGFSALALVIALAFRADLGGMSS